MAHRALHPHGGHHGCVLLACSWASTSSFAKVLQMSKTLRRGQQCSVEKDYVDIHKESDWIIYAQ